MSEQKSEVTDEEIEKFLTAQQKRLHDQAMKSTSAVFASFVEEMTVPFAVEAATNFFVASVVYIYEISGKLDQLDGRVMGREIERRIKSLKADKNGTKG